MSSGTRAALRTPELFFRLLYWPRDSETLREWAITLAEGTRAPFLGQVALAALKRVELQWMVNSGTSPELGAIVPAVLRGEELGTMDTHSVDVVLCRWAFRHPGSIASAGLNDVHLQRLAAAAARRSHHLRTDESPWPDYVGSSKPNIYRNVVQTVPDGPIRDVFQEAYRQRGIELDTPYKGGGIGADQFKRDLAQTSALASGEQWTTLVMAYAARGELGSGLVLAFQQATDACHGVENTEWLMQPMANALGTYRLTLGNPSVADGTTVAVGKVLKEFALEHPRSAAFVVLSPEFANVDEGYLSEAIVLHLDLTDEHERDAFVKFMEYANHDLQSLLFQAVSAKIQYHRSHGLQGQIPNHFQKRIANFGRELQ